VIKRLFTFLVVLLLLFLGPINNPTNEPFNYSTNNSINNVSGQSRLEKELTPLILDQSKVARNETVGPLEYQTFDLYQNILRLNDMAAIRLMIKGTGIFKVELKFSYELHPNISNQDLYSYKATEQNVNFNNNNEYEIISGITVSDTLFLPVGHSVDQAIDNSNFTDNEGRSISQWDRIVKLSITVINGLNENVTTSLDAEIISYRYALSRAFLEDASIDRSFSLRLVNLPFSNRSISGSVYSSDEVNWIIILPHENLLGTVSAIVTFEHHFTKSLITDNRVRLQFVSQGTSSIDQFMSEGREPIDYDTPFFSYKANLTASYVNELRMRGSVSGSIGLISITFEYIDSIERPYDFIIDYIIGNEFTTIIYLQVLLWGVYAGMNKKRQNAIAAKVKL
jgi:hypothetical protein